MKIRKNDTVLVITGKDNGKKGKVRLAYPKDNHVIVEGLNMVKRHTKPAGQSRPGGIVEREAPISAASVMYLCSKCNHPSRIGYRFLADGRKVRICRACQEVID
jgi:large subunit ribosomal protein L24